MHKKHLLYTLSLAEKWRGSCAPNPSVACIVVKGDEIIGEGVHRGAGKMHAETSVLQALGERARGATMYVSLEPCNHWGKTPPCTDAIIKAGIIAVYFAYHDPNPLVSQNSTTQILEKQGISCQHIELLEARQFYRSYSHWLTHDRPLVTAKIAQSLDAKIALEGGTPLQITGPECRAFTHQGRANSDVLMTSSRTLNQDNPKFNARIGGEILKRPLAILDRRLNLRQDLQVHETTESLLIFHDESITSPPSKERISYVGIPTDELRGLDLSRVLEHLGQLGYHDVWFEGGGVSFTALIEANLVDTAHIYIAGRLLGHDAIDAYPTQAQLLSNIKSIQWQPAGDDVIATIEF